MPSATPLSSVVADLGRGLLHVLLGLLRVVHAEVVEPALDLVERLVELRRDVTRVGRDPAEDEEEDEHADGDEPEEDEDRAADARNPVAFQPAHRGSGHRAEHRGEDHRHDDRRGLVEQPDDPEDDQHEADQQPRREAQVPEPRRSGEPGHTACACGGRHPTLRSIRVSRIRIIGRQRAPGSSCWHEIRPERARRGAVGGPTASGVRGRRGSAGGAPRDGASR